MCSGRATEIALSIFVSHNIVHNTLEGPVASTYNQPQKVSLEGDSVRAQISPGGLYQNYCFRTLFSQEVIVSILLQYNYFCVTYVPLLSDS